MQSQSSDQGTILLAVVAKLQLDLSLTESTCFISSNAFPPYSPPSDLFIMVSPGGGTYDGALYEGGGGDQVEETGTIVINICSTVNLDQAGHDYIKTTDDTLGMIAMKREVLKSLKDFMPLANDGITGLLRDEMEPVQHTAPQAINEKIAMMSVAFSASFDWDLS